MVERTTEVLGWTIDPQQPEANGRYTCVAANLLGVAETSLIVNITGVSACVCGCAGCITGVGCGGGT